MLESSNWLYMYMPMSDVSIFWPGLVLIGFLSGVFGVGYGMSGTWMVTPGLNILGFPMVFAVGTSITQTAGMSMIFAIRHFRLDNVDYKLCLIMSLSTITGLETGTQVVMHLERAGLAGSVVRFAYMVFLGVILLFVILDHTRTTGGKSTRDKAGSQANEAPRRGTLPKPAFSAGMYDSASSIRCLVWGPVLVSLLTGVAAGILGIGGSMLRLPALVYLVGCPAHVSVGTDIFESMFSGMYGAFSYAYKGRVELVAAVVILVCATIGEVVGTVATKYVSNSGSRRLFIATALCCLASVILKQARFDACALALLLGGMTLICLKVLKHMFQGVAADSRDKKTPGAPDSSER